MPVPAGPMPNVRSLRVDVARDTRADSRRAPRIAAALHAHRHCSSVRRAVHDARPASHARSRSARCTRSGVTASLADELEQLAQHVLRRVAARAPVTRKFVAAARRISHVQALLDQAQVLVERAARGSRAARCRRLELEFATVRAASCDGTRAHCEQAAAQRCCGSAFVIDDVGEPADQRLRARRSSPSALFSVRPASSLRVLLRRPLDQHALHAADHRAR